MMKVFFKVNRQRTTVNSPWVCGGVGIWEADGGGGWWNVVYYHINKKRCRNGKFLWNHEIGTVIFAEVF